MSDLISRQAIMKEFSDFVRRANNSDFAETPTWNDAVSLVGSLPSAEVTLCHLDSPCEYQNADIAIPSAQPEIIRCKDCKYAEVADTEDSQDGYTCQFHRGSIWFSGSYCSWGERRTDERSD